MDVSLPMLGDRGGVSIWNPDRGVTIRRLPVYGDKAARWSIDGKMLFALGPATSALAASFCFEPDALCPHHHSPASQASRLHHRATAWPLHAAMAAWKLSMRCLFTSAISFKSESPVRVSFSERGLIA